jgi:hypothetical protein
MSQPPANVQPGRSLGWMTLGSSLHAVLSKVKSQPQLYPKIDLSYSSSNPLLQPVLLNLPANGLRLRFDGPEQQLRLIEVLEFSGTHVVYKNVELVKRQKPSSEMQALEPPPPRPTFKHIYNRLFGPAYAGEYVPPELGHSTGTYVLSYPGLAFSFPVQHKSWSDKADFVSILSSSATAPASSMAVFAAPSWPEARSSLYTEAIPPHRPAASTRGVPENAPDDIKGARIHGGGKVEFYRKLGTSVVIQLGQTTPQDLVTEFGAPEAIYRKYDNRISIHAGQRRRSHRGSSMSPALDPTAIDTDHSSLQSYTDDSDIDSGSNLRQDPQNECFYNYFHYGFDALVSTAISPSPQFPASGTAETATPDASHQTVTKLMIHGNVPGSYSFNRHRRCPWTITPGSDTADVVLTSEMSFIDVSTALKKIWHNSYASPEEERQMQRGMVLNRGWGESPDSSIELLGGFEESPSKDQGQAAVMNNTELFGFPGMLFEVLKNDTVSCVTIY